MTTPKKKSINSPLKENIVNKDEIDYFIFTDGGCNSNGATKNIGAYSFIIVDKGGNIIKEETQVAINTTNNRCELRAIVWALETVLTNLPTQSSSPQFLLHSDSSYCVNGYNEWLKGWIKKNWADVKNEGLWAEIAVLKSQLPNVQVKWVKAHQTTNSFESIWNSRVDENCTKAIQERILQNELGKNSKEEKGGMIDEFVKQCIDKQDFKPQFVVNKEENIANIIKEKKNAITESEQLLLDIFNNRIILSELYMSIANYLQSKKLI